MLTLDYEVVFVDSRTENGWEELEDHVQEGPYAEAVQVFPVETPDAGRCSLCMSLVAQLCGSWVIKGSCDSHVSSWNRPSWIISSDG